MRAQRQPFQYKGQAGYYADAHTGLYYCHHRYYNPVLARWMSVDPIGLEGGFNVYQYCGGDPVNHVDPSGPLSSDKLLNFSRNGTALPDPSEDTCSQTVFRTGF